MINEDRSKMAHEIYMDGIKQLRTALAKSDLDDAERALQILKDENGMDWEITHKLSSEYPQEVYTAANHLLSSENNAEEDRDIAERNVRALTENAELVKKVQELENFGEKTADTSKDMLKELTDLSESLTDVRKKIKDDFDFQGAIEECAAAVEKLAQIGASKEEEGKALVLQSTEEARNKSIDELVKLVMEFASIFKEQIESLLETVEKMQNDESTATENAIKQAAQATAVLFSKNALELRQNLFTLKQETGGKTQNFLDTYEKLQNSFSALAIGAKAFQELKDIVGESLKNIKEASQLAKEEAMTEFKQMQGRTEELIIALATDKQVFAQLKTDLNVLANQTRQAAVKANADIDMAIMEVRSWKCDFSTPFQPNSINFDLEFTDVIPSFQKLSLSLDNCVGVVAEVAAMLKHRESIVVEVHGEVSKVKADLQQLKSYFLEQSAVLSPYSMLNNYFEQLQMRELTIRSIGAGIGTQLEDVRNLVQEEVKASADSLDDAISKVIELAGKFQRFPEIEPISVDFPETELLAVIDGIKDRLQRIENSISQLSSIDALYKEKYEQAQDLLEKLQVAKQKADDDNCQLIEELEEQVTALEVKEETAEKEAQTVLDVDSLEEELAKSKMEEQPLKEKNQILSLAHYKNPEQFIDFYAELRPEPDNVLFTPNELQTLLFDELKTLKRGRKLREKNYEMLSLAFQEMHSWFDDVLECERFCESFNVQFEQSKAFVKAFKNFIASKYNIAMDQYFEPLIEGIFMREFPKYYDAVSQEDEHSFFKIFAMLSQLNLYNYQIESVVVPADKIFVFPCLTSANMPKIDALCIKITDVVR